MGSILGNRVTRVEDPRFLTTGGNYVDDIRFDGEAHVVYARSPYAHADITSIDIADAVDAPGVLGVFTAADLAGLKPIPAARPGMPEAMGQVILASDRVRFVGQAVVAVVAETQAEAMDAAEMVFVDYEPLPVVVDVEVSARDEALLFPDAGTNHVLELASPNRADFSACEVVVEERIVNQRLSGAPMEPRVGAAYWTHDGRLVHYSACQGAHPTKVLLVDDLRPRARPGARGRARHGRRVRREVAHVPGGGRARLLRERRSAGRCAGPRRAPRTSSRCRRVAARCSTQRSAAPATAASPPTSSTCSRTPAPTR